MNEKKDITISNSAFSLTIHWNGALFSTQMCILGMCALVYFIASNQTVKSFCIGILILDVIAVILSMFFGGSKEDATAGTTSAAVNSTPAEAPPTKGTTTKSKKTSTKTQNKEIKNKLNVATPKQTPVTAATTAVKPTAPAQQAKVETIIPTAPEVEMITPVEPETITADIETVSADDISLEDFDFEDFDL